MLALRRRSPPPTPREDGSHDVEQPLYVEHVFYDSFDYDARPVGWENLLVKGLEEEPTFEERQKAKSKGNKKTGLPKFNHIPFVPTQYIDQYDSRISSPRSARTRCPVVMPDMSTNEVVTEKPALRSRSKIQLYHREGKASSSKSGEESPAKKSKGMRAKIKAFRRTSSGGSSSNSSAVAEKKGIFTACSKKPRGAKTESSNSSVSSGDKNKKKGGLFTTCSKKPKGANKSKSGNDSVDHDAGPLRSHASSHLLRAAPAKSTSVENCAASAKAEGSLSHQSLVAEAS